MEDDLVLSLNLRVVHLGRSTCHAISGPLSVWLFGVAEEIVDEVVHTVEYFIKSQLRDPFIKSQLREAS